MPPTEKKRKLLMAGASPTRRKELSMSEVMLTIIDAERAIHDTQHSSVAEAVIAALAAEPETIAELEIALARFRRLTPERTLFTAFFQGVSEVSWDAGIVIIDLPARMIAAESTYFSPLRSGTVFYHDAEQITDIELYYQLPDDWEIEDSIEQWCWKAPQRRAERAAHPPLDARPILYGRALSEFVVQECWQKYPRASEDPIADIHARWLMTPRPDLRGQTPREILLSKRDFIETDVNWRAHQWACLGECPAGLELDSAAYRYAGFGTHENVVYYELLRYLLSACWQAAPSLSASSVAAEVERLEHLKNDWLYTPSKRYDVGFSPNYIIEQERQRLPVTMASECAIIEDDCPLCQERTNPEWGPMFWHLDGSSMEDSFVFSFHHTLEDYETEQREWQELAEKFERERQERLARGEPEYPGYLRGNDYVFADDEAAYQDEEPDKPEYLC
jgi:hypothetical protein